MRLTEKKPGCGVFEERVSPGEGLFPLLHNNMKWLRRGIQNLRYLGALTLWGR